VKKVTIAGVLEIQEILKKLDEKTRTLFMGEIENEIDRLSQEQKRAYSGEEEKLEGEILKDVESFITTPKDSKKQK